MKKPFYQLSLLLLLTAASVTCLQGCSIVQLIVDVSDRQNVRVTLCDDSEIAGKTNFGSPTAKRLRIKTEDGEKLKIESSETVSLCLYREKYPENQYFFQYIPYAYYSKKKGWTDYTGKSYWLAVEEIGDNIIIYAHGGQYDISKKGDLTISSKGVIYYIARKAGDAKGALVGIYNGNRAKFYKNDLLNYLSDDHTLCSMIENGEIEDGDFQTIAEEYNPDQQ